jgi:hypothetical protein
MTHNSGEIRKEIMSKEGYTRQQGDNIVLTRSDLIAM